MRVARLTARGIRATVALLALAAAASPAALAGAPTQPPPPASGFGAPVAGVAVERGSIENPVARKHRVFWFRPAAAADSAGPASVSGSPKTVPVIVFLHGFGADSPEPYSKWLEHLAARGAIVVYPTYAGLDLSVQATRYDTMWAGAEAALRALADGPGVRPDPARLGVVGHSFGGGAAPAIAARAWARDWGKDGLFIACLAAWYDLDREAWQHLPAHACLLCVEYHDDQICDPGIGATFPALATTIPADRKAVCVLRSDAHGTPALVADHFAPLTTAGIDALDARGSWRLVDALAAFALEGSAEGRAVALGGAGDALSLGQWSDGTPIAPAAAAWDPSTPRHRRLMWKCGGFGETQMRRLLGPESYSTLPLPDPKTVVASRLLKSERFLASPPDRPADGWPRPVEDALKRRNVLVVPAGAAPANEELRVGSAEIVRLTKADGASLYEALDRAAGPTALLLSRDGTPLLWMPVADGNLGSIVAALSDASARR